MLLFLVLLSFVLLLQPFMSPRYPGGPRGPGPVRMPPNQVDFNVSFKSCLFKSTLVLCYLGYFYVVLTRNGMFWLSF